MTLKEQILAAIGAYCAATEVDVARASQRALGDRRLLVRLASGVSTITVDRADRALIWFSDHWPDGAEWPPAVPRPVAASDVPSPDFATGAVP